MFGGGILTVDGSARLTTAQGSEQRLALAGPDDDVLISPQQPPVVWFTRAAVAALMVPGGFAALTLPTDACGTA